MLNLPTSLTRLALLAAFALGLTACNKVGKTSAAAKPEAAAHPAAPGAATPVSPEGKLAQGSETPLSTEAADQPQAGVEAAPVEKSMPPVDNPEYGRIVDRRYTNPYFQFSLSVPDRYTTAMGLELGGIANKGAELLSGDNAGLADRLKANRPKYFRLLCISEQPLDVPQERNPTILVVAERLDEPMTGQQYLEQVDSLLTNSLLPYTKTGAIEPVTKGKMEFFLATYKLEKAGTFLYQSYIVTMRKGYALSFIATDTDLHSLASLRDYAMLSRFDPLIGEDGNLADTTAAANPEEALDPKRPEPHPGSTLFLKDALEPAADLAPEAPAETTLPDLPHLGGLKSAATDDAAVEPELPTMTPRTQASPGSRPLPHKPGSGVPAAATSSLPPLPAAGRDDMQGADDMGATPVSIEPADAN